MKTCVRCGEDCPRENFYAHKKTLDGLDSWCKNCHREVRAARYVRDAAKVASQGAAWDAANRERRREISRRSYHNNPVANMARARAWKSENPERWRMIQKAGELARRGRELSAKGHATADQVAGRIAMYANRCWMCGGSSTEIDHVIPLARGGTNWPSNLRPACRSCNASKGARLVHLEAVA